MSRNVTVKPEALAVWLKYREYNQTSKKPHKFSECHKHPPLELTQAEFNALPLRVVDGGPCDDIPGINAYDTDTLALIVRHGNLTYYVNTEGYSYCRFVCPVVVKA